MVQVAADGSVGVGLVLGAAADVGGDGLFQGREQGCFGVGELGPAAAEGLGALTEGVDAVR